MTAVLICLLAMGIFQVLTPYWWWVMVIPFAYGFGAARSGWKAFRTGFLSAGLLWLGSALYFFLTGSRTIAGRMADMFGLGDSWLIIASTGLLAGLAAASSAFAGWSVRALLKR